MISGSVGRPRFRSRKKTDVNPNVDIHATHVEFEVPQTATKRLFNVQMLKLVDRLPFSRSINPKTTNTWQDTIDIHTKYQFVDGDKGREQFRRLYPLREAIERFSENLRRPPIWSFSHRGAELQLSALTGYAGGPYTYRRGYPELASSAVAGFQLPP